MVKSEIIRLADTIEKEAERLKTKIFDQLDKTINKKIDTLLYNRVYIELDTRLNHKLTEIYQEVFDNGRYVYSEIYSCYFLNN